MRKFLLAGLCLFVNCTSLLFAQNKTLGVGVATPNPNAALHVESPTGNQGFIMPRLTTGQRQGMTELLTTADQGLMLYDTDLYTIYIWNGMKWESSAQFTIDDPLSTANGIEASSMGSGSAGKFSINNPASFSHAVYAENNGDSTSAAVHGYHLGNGFGVFGKSSGSKFASAAVYGEHTGTGDAAGAFRITNAASTYSALFGETNGTGPAVFGNQKGLGRGGQFQITNASNSNAAIRSFTSGTGYAGFYTINNPANASAGIFSTTNGTGVAIFGETTGTGSAGKFIVNNVSSPSPVLWAETNSNQPLSAPIYGLNTGTGDAAASFRISNSASTFPALFAESNGTGRTATFRKLGGGSAPAVYIDSKGGSGIWADHNSSTGYAGIFQTINASNSGAAVLVETIGSGPSVWALKSTDAISGDALRAENMIAAGSAASFAISNATNTYPVISTTTNGTGAAIRAENSGAGNGFAATFEVTNAANQYPAVQVSSAGAGSGVRVMQPTGTGAGVDVFMQNPSSPASGVAVDQGGSGYGGSFIISNPSNTSHAVHAITNGNGRAGEFTTTNPLNAAPTISATHEGDGLAFAVLRGGVKVTVMDITTATIPTRASAYRILGGGITFSLGFTPSEGELFMIYNESGQPVTFTAGGLNHTIPVDSGKTFIVFGGGAVRGF